ncbi:MAG: hypothetical protein IAF02_25920 [Anaerolineae bacterium]|nr:hypothetical protein [Anaerolineae bacterium]
MSVQMVIEMQNEQGRQSILSAIEAYKQRLQASIVHGQRLLADFEQRYDVATDYFLANMTAEDLEGGDEEYVDWAGEAHLLKGLQTELAELENARFQLQ